MTGSLEPTPRTTHKRAPDRGRFDRETIYAILDEGLVAHLAFAAEGVPHMIPMAYARIDGTLYVHGAVANRALRSLATGGETCICVTLLDGIVLARSAFHTSMNYRCVVLYGALRSVEDPSERHAALRAIVEHAAPGRWDDVRAPNEVEVKRTHVLALSIEEGSAKVRAGGPVEDEEDYALACWGGVIPLSLQAGKPQDDERLAGGVTLPRYASEYRRGA